MRNYIIIALGCLCVPTISAQVGIGTNTPVNTFEVLGTSANTSNAAVSSSNGLLRVVGSTSNTTLDFGLQTTVSASWIQSRDKSNYSIQKDLRLQQNSGRVGIGITGVPQASLEVGGTIGATGSIRGNAAGQVLKHTVLDASDLGVSTSFSVNNTSGADVISYNYTPVSNSSKLLIKFNTSSNMGGSAVLSADEQKVSITVNDGSTTTTLQSKRQLYSQGSGTGVRSSILFPVSGIYSNSGTGSLTIKVRLQRTSGDDAVLINTDMVLSILEIAQ